MKASISFSGNKQALRDLERYGNKAFRAGLTSTLNDISKIAKQLAPKDSGELRASIHPTQVVRHRSGEWGGSVVADAPHASFVEEGTTGPITPKRHKVLRFQPTKNAAGNKYRKQRDVVYVKYVDGQDPQPFLAPAYKEGIRNLHQRILQSVRFR